MGLKRSVSVIGLADTAFCDQQSVIGLKNPDRSTPNFKVYLIKLLMKKLWSKYSDLKAALVVDFRKKNCYAGWKSLHMLTASIKLSGLNQWFSIPVLGTSCSFWDILHVSLI